MSTIRAIVKGGRIELTAPPDWPDGTEVEVTPLSGDAGQGDGPLAPDEIVRALAAMAVLRPLELTEAEEATLVADRHVRKEWEKTHFDERADAVREQWE